MINKWKFGLSINLEILFNEPVNKLSKQMILWPNSSKVLQRCDPINPAPPVTKIFLVLFSSKSI